MLSFLVLCAAGWTFDGRDGEQPGCFTSYALPYFVADPENVGLCRYGSDSVWDYGMNDANRENPFKAFAKAEFLRHFGAPVDPRRGRAGLYMSTVHGPVGRRAQASAAKSERGESRVEHTVADI